MSPGVRGHSLVFTVVMLFLFATALAGQSVGAGGAWTTIFAVGAAVCGTYLVMALLALFEKARNLILYSHLTTRAIVLAVVFVPLLAGVSYWINSAGSAEALPIFPVFIAIFYGWVLLQAYFIASPISHLLSRVEASVRGEGGTKKTLRTLGMGVLFLPAVPLIYGVVAVSGWLTNNYASVQGSAGSIAAWTVAIIVIVILSYLLTVRWGWNAIRQHRPEAAIFVGGTFLALWSYLLYRATVVEMGVITQNQPTNPVFDSVLMLVAIIGAMQTFARKTVDRGADKRWGQLVPFLVFAFGSAYAVAQFYFVLAFTISRLELSILVNATVFAFGIFTMMFLIRKHLNRPLQNLSPTELQLQRSDQETRDGSRHSLLRFPWKRTSRSDSSRSTSPENVQGNRSAANQPQVAEDAQKGDDSEWEEASDEYERRNLTEEEEEPENPDY